MLSPYFFISIFKGQAWRSTERPSARRKLSRFRFLAASERKLVFNRLVADRVALFAVPRIGSLYLLAR